MIYVDTGWVIASVADTYSFWNIPIDTVPSISVSQNTFSFSVDFSSQHAVTKRTNSASPFGTIIFCVVRAMSDKQSLP